MSKTKVKLSFECNQDFDRMKSCGDLKFCDLCQNKIHDFRGLTEDEFRHKLQ